MMFWGVIAIVFGILWLITLLGFIGSRFFNSKIVRWIGFIPFAVMTLIPICLAGMMFYTTRPPQIFKLSFDFYPTGDVDELRSQYWVFGDYGSTYLKFKANRETIERIAKLGFAKHAMERGAEKAGAITVGGDQPDWWAPQWPAMTHIYSKTNRIGAFRKEQEDLYYDERTQQAYYSYIGID